MGAWGPSESHLGGADIFVEFSAPEHVAEAAVVSVKQLARRNIRLNQIDPDYPDYTDEAQELIMRQIQPSTS